MTAKTHGLGYRVWNQVRLAMHVDSYLQIYEELAGDTSREHWSGALSRAMSTMRHVLFQVIVVHLDMIKARRGVSLYSLIQEARDLGHIDGDLYRELRDEIDQHNGVLGNIGKQRNNIVAHRSPSLTFAQIKDRFPVAPQDLSALSKTYYSVAIRLHHKVPFNRPWELADCRTGIREIMRAVDQYCAEFPQRP